MLVAAKGGRWSDPEVRAVLRQAQDGAPAVFEAGPRATFHRKLIADGLPAAGIDARHATRYGADGLALLGSDGVLPGGSRQELRGDAGEAIASQAIAEGQALIGGRAQLVGVSTQLSNHLRGVMKTFGRIVPAAGGF